MTLGFFAITSILATVCYIVYVILFGPREEWTRWFAWYPVYIDGERFFFKMVERKGIWYNIPGDPEFFDMEIVYRKIKE